MTISTRNRASPSALPTSLMDALMNIEKSMLIPSRMSLLIDACSSRMRFATSLLTLRMFA